MRNNAQNTRYRNVLLNKKHKKLIDNLKQLNYRIVKYNTTKNNNIKFEYFCDKNHYIENGSYNSIIYHGSKCPKCSGVKKYTLQEIRSLYIKKGFKFLENKYKGASIPSYTKHSKCGYKWYSYPSFIINNKSGCPYCAGQVILKKNILSLAGKNLTIKTIFKKDILSGKAKITYICNNCCFKETKTIANFTISPHCKNCSKRAPITLQMAKELASIHNGHCLSKDAVKSTEKFIWQCELLHRPFMSLFSNVKKGQWCPTCSSNKSEKIVRAYFEYNFRKSFPSIKPKWLSYNGIRLELDGYNESMRLAFEFQGEYHFKIDRQYTKTKKQLLIRKNRDYFKKITCKELGIKFVEIKYYNKIDNPVTIKQQVINKLNKLGYSTNRIIKYNPPLNIIYSLKDQLKIREIINAKNYIFILFNAQLEKELTLKCDRGFEFQISIKKLKQGQGCNHKECIKHRVQLKRKLSLEKFNLQMKLYELASNYKFYVNAHTNITYRCNKYNHQISERLSTISTRYKRYGFACKVCNDNK